jgi:hypothetical protein
MHQVAIVAEAAAILRSAPHTGPGVTLPAEG